MDTEFADLDDFGRKGRKKKKGEFSDDSSHDRRKGGRKKKKKKNKKKKKKEKDILFNIEEKKIKYPFYFLTYLAWQTKVTEWSWIMTT